MKLSRLSILYFLAAIFIFSCNSDDSNDTNPTRTYADLEEDFNAFNFTTGINDVVLQDFTIFLWKFRVIMPDVDFTNNNRPLVITLHGFANGDPNAHKNTACYAEPGFESLDAIIISPNSDNLQWFHPLNEEMILTLVQLASENLPVDTSKIVVNGYSDGGNGAWWFSETQSSVFSAGIPMASAYGSYNPDGTARVIPTPTYVIHGENDELFPLQNTQDWVDDTVASGSDVTLVIAPGLTHIQPCDYTPYLQDAADWLVNTVWD